MSSCYGLYAVFFFFNDTATTEIYTLSLHDALPISLPWPGSPLPTWTWPRSTTPSPSTPCCSWRTWAFAPRARRSEEHTSELQSQSNLVCRLLLEKKKRGVRLSPRQSAEGQSNLRRS